MPEYSVLNSKRVLFLAKEGPERENYSKPLRAEGYEVDFTADLNKILDLLATSGAAILIHDWAATDAKSGIAFQHKLAKMESLVALCRIVYAAAITPQLIALAADAGLRRMISYQTSPTNLVSEIGMALNSTKSTSDLQKLVYRLQFGGKYDQKVIDEQVALAYERFSHDGAVKLEYGNLLIRQEKFNPARALAEQILREQPLNVRAMNLLGRILLKSGDIDSAIRQLETANTLSPFNTDRLVMIGQVLLDKGDTTKAEAYFSEAIDLSPSDTSAKKGMSQVKLREGDINAALDLLNTSASEEEAAGYFNNAAVIAAHKGESHKSVELYEAALKVLKTDRLKSIVHFNMALTQERQGNLGEALSNLDKSLKFDKSFVKAQRQHQRITSLIAKTRSERSAG